MANRQSLAFPCALGLIQPGASFATVSVPLNFNLPATSPDGLASTLPYNEIELVANPANTAPIYICVALLGQAANIQADTTNFTNVIAVLQPGDTWGRYANPAYSNKWFLQNLYVSAGNATDSVYGSAGRV